MPSGSVPRSWDPDQRRMSGVGAHSCGDPASNPNTARAPKVTNPARPERAKSHRARAGVPERLPRRRSSAAPLPGFPAPRDPPRGPDGDRRRHRDRPRPHAALHAHGARAAAADRPLVPLRLVPPAARRRRPRRPQPRPLPRIPPLRLPGSRGPPVAAARRRGARGGLPGRGARQGRHAGTPRVGRSTRRGHPARGDRRPAAALHHAARVRRGLQPAQRVVLLLRCRGRGGAQAQVHGGRGQQHFWRAIPLRAGSRSGGRGHEDADPEGVHARAHPAADLSRLPLQPAHRPVRLPGARSPPFHEGRRRHLALGADRGAAGPGGVGPRADQAARPPRPPSHPQEAPPRPLVDDLRDGADVLVAPPRPAHAPPGRLPHLPPHPLGGLGAALRPRPGRLWPTRSPPRRPEARHAALGLRRRARVVRNLARIARPRRRARLGHRTRVRRPSGCAQDRPPLPRVRRRARAARRRRPRPPRGVGVRLRPRGLGRGTRRGPARAARPLPLPFTNRPRLPPRLEALALDPALPLPHPWSRPAPVPAARPLPPPLGRRRAPLAVQPRVRVRDQLGVGHVVARRVRADRGVQEGRDGEGGRDGGEGRSDGQGGGEVGGVREGGEGGGVGRVIGRSAIDVACWRNTHPRCQMIHRTTCRSDHGKHTRAPLHASIHASWSAADPSPNSSSSSLANTFRHLGFLTTFPAGTLVLMKLTMYLDAFCGASFT